MINSLSLIEVLGGLRSKKFSPVELVESCLSRIKSIDPEIHAFISLNPNALEEAKKADVTRPLGGVPIAVKDNFLTVGMPTTAASKVLDGYMPHYESTVTRKLKEAGAIIIGKTNMDAWAHGSSTETSDYGPTKNPWNTAYLPGGSSGGSAAAVAADMCIAAIGSETAGSIRQPAAWCGITGFKPSYGRVSRYGVIAMASSTDCPGPLSKTVADAALLTQIIAGHDKFDATSSPSNVPELLPKNKKVVYKIGVPEEYLEVLEPAMKKAVQLQIEVLKSLGHKVELTRLIHPKYSIGVYTILQRAEVSSNLARYDGVRFGHSRSRFGAEAKRRIMLGTYVLSSGYQDQYYIKAQKIRTLIIEDFHKAFSKFDLLLDPASPGPALKIGASKDEPMFGEMQDILVEPSSIAGLTGISVPGGFISDMPISFGLIGPQLSEDKVIQAAFSYQSVTDWHLKRPKI